MFLTGLFDVGEKGEVRQGFIHYYFMWLGGEEMFGVSEIIYMYLLIIKYLTKNSFKNKRDSLVKEITIIYQCRPQPPSPFTNVDHKPLHFLLM